MFRYFAIALAAMPGLAARADAPDPEIWYRTAYAPLWTSDPGQHIDEMLAQHAVDVTTRAADGDVIRGNREIWLGRDRYQGSDDEFSCGWYLADYRDGKRRFSTCADPDCAAHGLE